MSFRKSIRVTIETLDHAGLPVGSKVVWDARSTKVTENRPVSFIRDINSNVAEIHYGPHTLHIEAHLDDPRIESCDDAALQHMEGLDAHRFSG